MSDDTYDSVPEDNEEDFATLLEASLSAAPRQLEAGKQVEATVLQVGDEWVFLDVGQKGEGILDRREICDADGTPTVAVGDRIKPYFIGRKDGELHFTLRLGGGATGTAQLEDAWRSGVPVEGRIEREIKGGFEVRLPGAVRAFCPFSQLGLPRTEDPADVVGTDLAFKITRFAEQGRNIVVSHREIVEEERRVRREELRLTLKEGMTVTGTVISVRDFGAFIDIGGIEGLLPISEVAYGRVDDLNELLQVGQEIEVAVKSCDWEANRFSFSRRDVLADPWGKVGSTYRVGSQLTGSVSRLVPFGAFITLEEGIDGLVHISKLGGGQRIRHPGDVLKVGQQLAVTIESIDPAARRIALTPTADRQEEPGETSWVEEPERGAGFGSLGDMLRQAQDKKGGK